MADVTTNANPAATESDLQAALGAAVVAADATAAQGLQMIGKLHQARIVRLNREAAALTAQGASSVASLAATQAEIAAEITTTAKVTMLSQRAATVDPAVTSTGWAMHGRLYSSDLTPAAACTVFLVDAQKAYQAAFGFSYTDATGYFAFTSAAQTPTTTADPAGANAAPASATAPSAGGAGATGATEVKGATAAAGATTPAQLFVAAADAKGEPVYIGATAFTPTLGVATYQIHVMPPGRQPIGDPPPAVRATALPKS